MGRPMKIVGLKSNRKIMYYNYVILQSCFNLIWTHTFCLEDGTLHAQLDARGPLYCGYCSCSQVVHRLTSQLLRSRHASSTLPSILCFLFPPFERGSPGLRPAWSALVCRKRRGARTTAADQRGNCTSACTAASIC